MSRQHYLTWEQAIKAVQQGKRLLFYHCGKAVPIDKSTTFQNLQWDYFGPFEITWSDLLNGKYSIIGDAS